MSKLFPQLERDDLGDVIRLEIDGSVFSAQVVLKAAYWFTEPFYLYIARGEQDAIHVEMRPKAAASTGELERAGAEFCNKVIDFAVRAQVEAETRPAREALIHAAFAEGLKSRTLGTAGSNEAALEFVKRAGASPKLAEKK